MAVNTCARNVTLKCHSAAKGARTAAFAQEKRSSRKRGWEIEIPAANVGVAGWKCLKILELYRFLSGLTKWLGGRESLPGLQETSIKTGLFRLSLTTPAI
jgi:hypothetical protein